MNIAALIPAYQPTKELLEQVKGLKKHFAEIVVVNDGSGEHCNELFDQLKTEGIKVLDHAVNCGKGSALKTGLNFIACHYPKCKGVVTIDADGQHRVEDAVKVAQKLTQYPDRLIIGSRAFTGNVPLRSRLGNSLTRQLFKWLTGIKVHDTQSGLRGIPLSFIPNLLKVRANRYEFELDMLLLCQRCGLKIDEVMIDTIYIENNASSHFRPLLDSLKIYFVLFRFTIIAILSALIDYGIFLLMYRFVTHKIAWCFVVGRTCSMLFNYINVRRFAFHSRETHLQAFPKYLSLVVISGSLAYALIAGLIAEFHFHPLPAKITSELIMFVVNFLVQRDFIFRRA